jgi:HEAT repeat protein
MKHKIAIPPLLRALSDPNPSVRVAAAQALDSISGHFRQIRPNLNWPSNSKFVPPLISLLADKNAKVRHAAIFCLSRIGPPARAAMKPLVSLYWFDTAQDQAGTLLVALWSIDPDNRASIAVFLDAAKSSEVSTRVFAANAMSHVKVDPVGRGIVRSLAEALADKTWNVRFQAACSLRRLGPVAKSAIPALNVATDDPDERVRRTATQALEVIKRNHPKTPQPSPSPRGRRRHCTGR